MLLSCQWQLRTMLPIVTHCWCAQEPSCADQVHKVMTRASSNVRFNMPLATACADDREDWCGDVQPVRRLPDRCSRLSGA